MRRPPRPKITMVKTSLDNDDQPHSIIIRVWTRRGAARCRLCPDCNAQEQFIISLCAVSTPGFIGDEEAAIHTFQPGDEMARFLGSVRMEPPGELEE